MKTQKPNRQVVPADEDKDQVPEESISLSPERIAAGASAQTEVLKAILACELDTVERRHWGINE